MKGKWKKLTSMLLLATLTISNVPVYAIDGEAINPIQQEEALSEEAITADLNASEEGEANSDIQEESEENVIQEETTATEEILKMIDEELPLVGAGEQTTLGISYLRDVVDGNAKLDEVSNSGDSNRGMDSDSHNGIVRSYDTISYELDTSITHPAGVPVGTVVFEFSIPEAQYKDGNGLNLNQGVIPDDHWKEEVRDGKHIYVVNIEIPLNGKSPEDFFTGEVASTFNFNVGSLLQGEVIQPEIRMWAENTPDDIHVIENVKAVTVTSAPMFNVVLKQNKAQGRNDYDLNNATYDKNNRDQTGEGYLETYGFGLQMRRTDPDKGMLGMEYPDGNPITFDVELNSTISDPDGNNTVSVNEYENGLFQPILYSYGAHEFGSDRIFELPWAYDDGGNQDATKCQNSGTIEAKQNGNIISIKVSDYKTDYFPTKNSGTVDLGSGEYYFSTGILKVIQPYSIDGNEKTLSDINANGSIEITAIDSNLIAHGLSGVNVVNDDQTVTSDDRVTDKQRLIPAGGKHDHEIYFSRYNHWTSGSDEADTTKNNGTDSATVGSDVVYSINFDESEIGSSKTEILNRAVVIDQLVTYDNAFLTPTATAYGASTMGYANSDYKLTVKYAGKLGGWDHKGLLPDAEGYDAEQLSVTAVNAKEKGIVYFDSLEVMEAAGYTGVGMLYQYRGIYSGTTNPTFITQTQLHVRDDLDLPLIDANGDRHYPVNMLFASSKYYTADDIYPKDLEVSIENIKAYVQHTYAAQYDATGTEPDETWSEINKSYNKAKYDETGYIGGDNAGWLDGDSLYIVPYISRINKKVAQKDSKSGDEKRTYDLRETENSKPERYADYVLEPTFAYEMNADIKASKSTTVTITDQLPEELHYIANSAYMGGTYSERQNLPGSVVGGTPINPTIETNEKGTLLTWTFDVEDISNPGDIKVYYSCLIGDPTGKTPDVVNEQVLSNTAKIWTIDDHRKIQPSNENQSAADISIIQGEAFILWKEGSVVQDGKKIGPTAADNETPGDDGVYDLTVNNTTSKQVDDYLAIDQMPSTDDISAQLKKVTVDRLASETEIYYTYSKEYKDLSTVEVGEIKYSDLTSENGWVKAVIEQTESGYEVKNGDGEALIGNWPVLIAFHFSEIHALTAYNIHIDYHSNGEKGDQYTNNFVHADQVAPWDTTVYTRSITGTAWFEENDVRNDTLDQKDTEGEYRLEGITVNLCDKDGNIVDTTTTNKDGEYTFENVGAGDYSITFENTESNEVLKDKSDVSALEKSEDSDEGNKSKAHTETSDSKTTYKIQKVTMPSIKEMQELGVTHYEKKEQNLGLTAAPRVRILSGYTWYETNVANNDVLDEEGTENETRLSNVTAILSQVDETGKVIKEADRTTTDEHGYYEFNLTEGGNYIVTFEDLKVTDVITKVIKKGENATANASKIAADTLTTDVIIVPTEEEMRKNNQLSWNSPNWNAGITDAAEDPSAPHKTETTPGDTKEVKAGDEITYEISYKNNNAVKADVVVTDALDAGVDFVSADNNGVYDEDSHTVTWTLKDVAALTEGKVSLKVKVNDKAAVASTAASQYVVKNQAEVKVGNAAAQKTETVTNPVTPADRTRSISGTAWFEPHDDEDAGKNVLDVTDERLENVIVKLYKEGGEAGDTLVDTTKTDENGDYKFTDIKEGGEYYVVFEKLEKDGTVTQLVTKGSNDATNTSKVSEQNKVTRTDSFHVKTDSEMAKDGETTWKKEYLNAGITDSTEVPTAPHKTEVTPGDTKEVKAGDEITYEISYKNNNATKADVVITDVLDAGVDFVSASDSGVYDSTAKKVTWTLNDVAALTEGKVTLKVQVNAHAADNSTSTNPYIIRNQAGVKIGNAAEVKTETVTNPVTPAERTRSVSGTAWFESHDADNDTKNILDDTDTRLENVTAVLYKKDAAGDIKVDETKTDAKGYYEFTGIKEGGEYYVVFEKLEKDGTVTELVNQGDDATANASKVKDDNGVIRTNEFHLLTDDEMVTRNIKTWEKTDRNAGIADSWEEPTAPHKSEVTPGDTETVKKGDEITYEISYKNNNAVKATVIVTDALDEGVDFVSADNGGAYDEDSHTVTWTLTDVAALTAGKVTLKVQVNEYASVKSTANNQYIILNQAGVKIGNAAEVKTEIVTNPVEPAKRNRTVSGTSWFESHEADDDTKNLLDDTDTRLENVIVKLFKKDADPKTPTSSKETKSSDKTIKANPVKTGDAAPLIPYAALLLIAAAVIVMMIRRKKDQI